MGKNEKNLNVKNFCLVKNSSLKENFCKIKFFMKFNKLKFVILFFICMKRI